MSILIQVERTKYIVNDGETVTFECKITGGTRWLTPFVKWRRTSKTNKTDIHEIKETRKEWNDANYILKTFLTIKGASTFDSGVYNCLVLRHISADIELDVLRFQPAKIKYEVAHYEPCTLECEIEELTEHSHKAVTWLRRCKKSGKIKLIEGKTEGYSILKTFLTIESSDEEDSGFYRCIIRIGDQELRSDEIELCVFGIVADNDEYDITFGSNAFLKFRWIDLPFSSAVTMFVNGSDFEFYNRHKCNFYSNVGEELTVYILNADLRDDGFYSCVAQYECNGSRIVARIAWTRLHVRAIVMTTLEYTVSYGATLTLECSLKGTSNARSVVWKRKRDDNTEIVSIDGSKYIGSTVSNPSLVIINVNNIDVGSYLCTATFGRRKECLSSNEVSVYLQENLSVIVTETLYNVQLHGSVTLQCTVSGTPSPYLVFWIKVTDGTETVLKYMRFQKGINVYETSIDNATDEDAGIYLCKTMSKTMEKKSDNIHVLVLGGYQTILDTFKIASYQSSQKTQEKEADLKYLPDTYCLSKRQKRPKIVDIQKLKVGMQVCFSKAAYNHHGIVTNVYATKDSYEIIHMSGDKDTITDKQFNGIAGIRKEKKKFDGKEMTFYDYGEDSLDDIIRRVHQIDDEKAVESIVSKRACLLHEAFHTFQNEVYYKAFSFNCEHFASYCATGLAFCKQKDGLAMKENTLATAILDKKLTIYCEEILGSKRPRAAELQILQRRCLPENKADTADLREMGLTKMSENDIEEGKEIVIFRKQHQRYWMNCIVTNVCRETETFEVVYLSTRIKGEADCQKVKFNFGKETLFHYNYDKLSDTKMNDRNTSKLCAEILFKIFHTLKEMKFDVAEFNCDHFATYCVAGIAYSKESKGNANEAATKTLDSKLIEYCARFIPLPE